MIVVLLLRTRRRAIDMIFKKLDNDNNDSDNNDNTNDNSPSRQANGVADPGTHSYLSSSPSSTVVSVS